MGIATPKKETANKTWSDDDLESALEALRRREISANKAAKIYKIPSSVSLVVLSMLPQSKLLLLPNSKQSEICIDFLKLDSL